MFSHSSKAPINIEGALAAGGFEHPSCPGEEREDQEHETREFVQSRADRQPRACTRAHP